VPEARRLLLTLTEPPERFGFRLAWSSFRRRHQAVAKCCHAARRARQHPSSLGLSSIQVLDSGTLELTDERWTRIAPLLPPQKPETGRPNSDHRTILAGIVWVIRTGASWRAIPERFGPWQTVHTRYQRWRKAGIWQPILDVLQQDQGDAPRGQSP
jgi:transposase